MNSDKYLGPSLFEKRLLSSRVSSDQEPNLGPFTKTYQKRPYSTLQC
jgi:hypothetical protein